MGSVRAGTQPVISFTEGVLDFEGYLEPGMRARLVAAREDGELIHLHLDFSEFEAFNQGFETANYYDSHGNPTLTARQAGYYPKNHRDDLIVDPALRMEYFGRIDSDASIALYAEYRRCGSEKLYVQWLEEQLLAHRFQEEDR